MPRVRFECWDIFGFGAATVRLPLPGADGSAADWDAVVHVFTRGQCHSFATAVCALIPGAEPVGVAWDDEYGMPDHVMAHLPDGRLMDATGVYDEVPERWHSWNPDEGFDEPRAEPVDVHALAENGYLEPRPAAAVPYVRAAANRFGVSI